MIFGIKSTYFAFFVSIVIIAIFLSLDIIVYTDCSTKTFYEIPGEEIKYEKSAEQGNGLVDVYVKKE